MNTTLIWGILNFTYYPTYKIVKNIIFDNLKSDQCSIYTCIIGNWFTLNLSLLSIFFIKFKFILPHKLKATCTLILKLSNTFSEIHVKLCFFNFQYVRSLRSLQTEKIILWKRSNFIRTSMHIKFRQTEIHFEVKKL